MLDLERQKQIALLLMKQQLPRIRKRLEKADEKYIREIERFALQADIPPENCLHFVHALAKGEEPNIPRDEQGEMALFMCKVMMREAFEDNFKISEKLPKLQAKFAETATSIGVSVDETKQFALDRLLELINEHLFPDRL